MNSLWGSAIAGGILGSLAIFLLNHWHQWREAKKNFNAALLVVIDELASNHSTIQSYIDMFIRTGRVSKTFRLRDDAYQSVRLVLARELEESVALVLGSAYGMVIFTDQMMQYITNPTHQDLEQLHDAQADIKTQIDELTSILRYGAARIPSDPNLRMAYKLFMVWLKNKLDEPWDME